MSWIPGRGPRDPVDEEIRSHIRERVELLVAEGWSPEEAWEEAERRFGDVERIRDELMEIERREGRRMRTAEMLRSIAADAAYGLRGLRTNPTFSLAVVATLALGIGAASSIFAVTDALLLRPLPFRDADRWVEVNQATDEGRYSFGLSVDRVREWKEAGGELLDGWAAYIREGLVRTDGDRTHSLEVVAVTPGADTLLGIPIFLGRGLGAGDARPGASPVAVLGRRYWERMGADRDVLGSTMRLESGPVTVVGVLGGGVKFPQVGDEVDLWLPLRDDFTFADREIRRVQALWARLPEATALEAAQERADALADALMERNPAERTWRVRLVPIDAHRAQPDVRQAIWTLTATVGVIFLIALVNGVNLLFVRATTRGREIAVRSAIGASRMRLLRQLVVEGLTLGLLGGVVAAGLVWGALVAIRGIVPHEVLYFSPHAFELESRTLLFAFGASVACGVVLGLLPAIQVLRRRRSGSPLAGRRDGDASGPRRLRDALVVGQVALSMTLLVAAGLLVNGFARLLTVEPGFDVDRIAIGDLMLSPTRYPDAATRAEFARRFEQALEAAPEIEAVAVSAGGFSGYVELEAEGRPVRSDQPERIPHSSVTDDYFGTMGVELVAGRGFEPGDAGSDRVVVDRDLARFLWGDASPVGERFRMGEEGDWLAVVGVVEELMLMGRDERGGPYQFLRARSRDTSGFYVQMAMRTAGPPEALIGVFERVLRRLDPEQSYWRLRTASDALAEEEEKPRFLVTLMSLLAAIAVTLAAVGLYGVLAYSVTRRRRELGIRIALGAARGRVRGMVVREGLFVTMLGIGIGLVGAVWAVGLLDQLLYDVEPHDPATFGVTVALFLAVALAASLLPARRATGVDPVEVLKAE